MQWSACRAFQQRQLAAHRRLIQWSGPNLPPPRSEHVHNACVAISGGTGGVNKKKDAMRCQPNRQGGA